MQQPGINNITLYENNGITFSYYDDETIVDIATTGETYEIDNCFLPKFYIKPQLNKNSRLSYEYEIEFSIEEMSHATLDQIEIISESIYGWKPLISWYDGRVQFLDEVLFIDDEIDIDPNQTSLFLIKMATKQLTGVRLIDYDSEKTMSHYRADTTLITADTTVYTADYY